MKRRILIFATGLLLGFAVLAQQPPALVRTANAALQNLAPMTQVPGTVVSRSDARLAAEVEGRLLQILDVGTVVAKHDVIAEIEDTSLQLRQAELEAEVTRAEASLRYLELEEKRLGKLAETGLTSATLVDQTRSQRDIARSDLKVAQTRLAQVDDQLDRTRIRAPFPGTVVERLARVGERLAVGTEVARIVNPDDLEVVARAPLEYINYVAVGDSLDLRTRNGHSVKATVRSVVAVGSENTHVFELRLDLPSQLFPVGQTLRVWVPTSDFREVLTVPRDALVLRSDGISVFIVDDSNTAQRVSVETGIGNENLIEIRGELNAGDKVITRGNERLRPGQAVQVL